MLYTFQNRLLTMGTINTILICNSNMFIPIVLTEILSNPQKQYIVLSDISNIKDFFSLLKLPNVIYYHYGFNPWRDGWFSFIKKKKNLYEYVVKYPINRIVFYHAEYGEMANWLLKKISHRANVEYCQVYDTIPAPKAQWSFKKMRIILSQYICWGQKMDILQGAYLFPSLPASFFLKINVKIVKPWIDIKLVSKCIRGNFLQNSNYGNIVLLTGSVGFNNIYPEKRYREFINSLILSVGKENIVSKCHPRYNNLYGLEKALIQVPSFIPGNLLLDCFNYYIGVESTLLVEAALAGKIAISIIDWLKPDENVRIIQHKFFENRLNGQGIIYYPKSISELKEIIAVH